LRAWMFALLLVGEACDSKVRGDVVKV